MTLIRVGDYGREEKACDSCTVVCRSFSILYNYVCLFTAGCSVRLAGGYGGEECDTYADVCSVALPVRPCPWVEP